MIASLTATGGLFGGDDVLDTVAVTVAEAVPPLPSEMVYVKLSVRELPIDGGVPENEYVSEVPEPLIVTFPKAPLVLAVIVNASPFGSLSFARGSSDFM